MAQDETPALAERASAVPTGMGMRQAIASHDWAATSLGPRESWPRALQAAVELILPNQFASVVLWGPDFIQVYNDAYRRVMADKHPQFLGRPTRECWPEAWDTNGPIYERVWRGETVSRDDARYRLRRNGRVADAWFDFSCSPIRDDAGAVGGILVTLVETTAWHNAEEERAFAETALRSSRAWLVGQGRSLQAALNGEPLEASLGVLVDTVVRYLGEGARAAFYVADADGHGFRHLVGMAAEHAMGPTGCDMQSGCPACGMGADGKDVRITPDVESDPYWHPWRELARRFHYRACWSFAIRASGGEQVGAFVVYLRDPADATPDDRGLAELVTRTAAIILSREAEAASRRQVLQALRDSEERHAFMLRLSDALRPLADATGIKVAAMQVLGAQIGASRAQYYTVDADGQVLRPEASFGAGTRPDADPVRMDAYDAFVAKELHAGRTLVVADVAADPRIATSEAYVARDIAAFIAVPLRKDGRLVGVLALHQSAARAWTAVEVAIVEEAAERTWSAVERARAEAALRLRDEQYHSLFDSMDEGCCVMEVEYGADGHIAELYFREVNAAFERQGGFADVLGEPVSRFMPNLAQAWRDAHELAMRTGEPTRVENFVAETGRWYSVQFARIGGAGSRLLAAVFQDVSERKAIERATARLAAIVESSDDAIIRKDLNGIIQTWNAGAERIFGYRADEVIGKPVTILMPPDRVDEEPGILARLRAGERITHYETVRRRKDGRLIDVSLSISPILDRTGNVVAASKIARDISQRKRAEAELRSAKERQSFLLRFADELRPLADAAEIQRVASRLVGEHFGVAHANYARVLEEGGAAFFEIGGSYVAPGRTPIAGRYPLADFPAAAELLRRGETLVVGDAAGDPQLGPIDKASCAAGGFATIVLVPLVKAGRLVATFAVHGPDPREWNRADVELMEEVAARTWSEVERALAEMKLRESEARLQRADRSKDEFIAMLSHELRNPLAPIATTLQLMKLRAPDVFTSERNVIEGQVAHLTGLVDDLLDVARIASGKVQLKLEPLELDAIVATAVETIQPAMERHRQSLEVHIERGLMVSGDRRRLVQVLVNLLGNAAKYSPPDRTVWLQVCAVGDTVELRVRDEGQGIDAELLPRVFELFRQGSQQLDRARGGLGLGLAIVDNLVKLHGGAVSAASEGRDRGSQFIVRLPRIERSAEVETALASAEGPALPEQVGSRTRVLIVDDYAVAAESMALLLEALGFCTYLAYDGASALRAVQDFAPQAALVDIGLPVMDGYEVARSIRAMPGFEKMPLIALTGYGQASDHARVIEAGFDEHLVKPLDAVRIGALIEKMVKAA